MGLFKNLLGLGSVDNEQENLQGSVDTVEEKKGLFERVSEKASSLVNSLRGAFSKKVDSVLADLSDENIAIRNEYFEKIEKKKERASRLNELREIAQQAALSGNAGTTVISEADDAVYYTTQEGLYSSADKDSYDAKSGTVVGTRRVDRSAPRRARRASSSIWSEFMRRNENKPKTPVRRTGTDSVEAFPAVESKLNRLYQVRPSEQSGVQSLLMLRHGIDTKQLTVAYENNVESSDNLLRVLERRVPASEIDEFVKLINQKLENLYNQGALNLEPLTSIVEHVVGFGYDSAENMRICRDAVKYAAAVNNENNILEIEPEFLEPVEMEFQNNDGLFEGFNNDERTLPFVDVTALEGVGVDLEEDTESSNGPKIMTLEEYVSEVSESEEEDVAYAMTNETDHLRETMAGSLDFEALLAAEEKEQLENELEEARRRIADLEEAVKGNTLRIDEVDNRVDRVEEKADEALRINHEIIGGLARTREITKAFASKADDLIPYDVSSDGSFKGDLFRTSGDGFDWRLAGSSIVSLDSLSESIEEFPQGLEESTDAGMLFDGEMDEDDIDALVGSLDKGKNPFDRNSSDQKTLPRHSGEFRSVQKD